MIFEILNLTFESLSFHLAYFVTRHRLELQLTWLLDGNAGNNFPELVLSVKAARSLKGWGCFSLNELWLSLLLVYGKHLKINSLGALDALFKHVSTSTRGERLDPLEKEIQELSCFGFKLSANVVF